MASRAALRSPADSSPSSLISACDAGAQLLPGGLRRVGVADLELVVEDLGQRPVGDSGAVRRALPAPDRRRILGSEPRVRHQLAEQPGLADSRLADHGDEVRAALPLDPLHQRGEQARLLLAADQRGLRRGRGPARGSESTPVASQAGTGSSLPFSVSGSSRS